MQKYEQIFYNQLNFMSSIDKMKFYSTQFNEIKPAIQKTIDFVDNYDCDWGDYKEKVLVNCIGVLPFILAKSFGNPELEDKKQIDDLQAQLNAKAEQDQLVIELREQIREMESKIIEI